MTTARPRVLFVSHSASRNGATILLLAFLRWLRAEVDWELQVLVNGRGPLLGEFAAVARTTVWRDPAPLLTLLFRGADSGVRRLIERSHRQLSLSGRGFDLVYANTSAAWPMVCGLLAAAPRGRSPPLLWHIHELDYALRETLPDGAAAALGRATRVVAVSRAVQDALTRRFGVVDQRVDLVHGFIAGASGAAADRPRLRRRARRDLGWPDDAFVIGGCGQPGWRKGSDLFLQIARRTLSAPGTPDLRFLWVGGDAASREAREFLADLDALGLHDRCRLQPTTADTGASYAAMDVFALTSREDPFPLVVLEAAVVGLPTVCFAGTGGAPEFVRDDAGVCVPRLDLDAFAAALLSLHAQPADCARLGSTGAQRVDAGHRVELQAPKLLRAMQATLDTAAVRPVAHAGDMWQER